MYCLVFFFFKQKTADEMRISDWSSDVCSSDLLGGTMRLGLQEQRLKPGTRAHAIYGKDVAAERHRHRYEFNNRYRSQLEEAGLVISAKRSEERRVGKEWVSTCRSRW